jgi:hypothetical protein
MELGIADSHGGGALAVDGHAPVCSCGWLHAIALEKGARGNCDFGANVRIDCAPEISHVPVERAADDGKLVVGAKHADGATAGSCALAGGVETEVTPSKRRLDATTSKVSTLEVYGPATKLGAAWQ